MTTAINTVKVYLAGPINGCTDEECNDWRQHIASFPFVEAIDPMVRDYRGREDEVYREIVELDKLDIINSKIVLVSYTKPSVGTSMEILYAWEHGKYVIVVAPKDVTISPWMKYHSNNIVTSYAEAVALILDYAEHVDLAN